MPRVITITVDGTSARHSSPKSWLCSIRQLRRSPSSFSNLLQSAGERSTLLLKPARFAVPLTYELEGACNVKVDMWHSVQTPAGSVWQGCTEILHRAWLTCKQILRRFRGAGTTQRRCSGPVKELHKKLLRACVTGTVYRQCAVSELQGQYTDNAQGLGDRDGIRQCAGSGWQGLYKTMCRVRVTGIAQRWFSGPAWQGLTQTVRRVWVTGTVCIQYAGLVWQGQHMAQGQGNTQCWSKRQNSVK